MYFTQTDFDYYRRSIKIMYHAYYQKRLVGTMIGLVIVAIYMLLLRESLVLNGLILLILSGIALYLIQQRQKFAEVYATFINENQPVKIRSIVEHEYYYAVDIGEAEALKINKTGLRNFPSSDKQYMLMVGFQKGLFSAQPLQIVYYDMLELTYEESYRLKRNGYQRLPKFLRRFTLANLKSSVGNATRFIFGNLLLLFIVYRLIRYLLRMLQLFF
ncbi:MAG: hypothetical protein ACK5MW_10490 [Enterococcus sp.]